MSTRVGDFDRMAARVLVVIALPTIAVLANAANLVTHEATRMAFLRVAFPDARISVSQDKPLNWRPDHNLTDALNGEKEYTVIGPLDRFEQAWANIYGDHSKSNLYPVRRMRAKVYAVESGQRETYVALTQYDIFFSEDFVVRLGTDFEFARLFTITRQADEWGVDHTNDSLLQWGKAIPTFKLLDINGDGQDEIVIEAEGSTAHRRWITMTILAVFDGRLHCLVEVETLSGSPDLMDIDFKAVLDVKRSRAAKGKAFYFTKTLYAGETGGLAKSHIEQQVVEPGQCGDRQDFFER